MTALAADRSTLQRCGEIQPFPVADNVKLYKHSLGVLSGGYAQPGSAALGLLAVGRVRKQYDNTVAGHALAAFDVEIEEGCFCWDQTGTTITAADVGSVAYVFDDHTVSKTNNGAQSPAGIIQRVDYAGVWIESSLELSKVLSRELAGEVGGLELNVTAAKTSAYTAFVGDFVKVDSSGGAVTITLPTAVGIPGQRIVVKDSGGAAATHNITVATTSSQTIDGASTATISTNSAAKTFVSDGANWFTS